MCLTNFMEISEKIKTGTASRIELLGLLWKENKSKKDKIKENQDKEHVFIFATN